MRTRAVLFDLDDTLFDHRHACRAGLEALRDAHSPLAAADLDELERLYLDLLNRTHLEVLAGRISMSDARHARMRAFLDRCAAPDADAAAATERYVAAYDAQRRPVPGAADLLRALRAAGIRVGVVSNNLAAEQAAKIEICLLGPLLDDAVISETVGLAKPDPAIFLLAARRLGVPPAETVMVGDSWSADVAGARAAGLRAVWLNRYAAPPQDPAVPTLSAFEPLADAWRAIVQEEPAPPVPA